MDVGDLYLADLGEERRRQVMVASSNQFTARSNRVVVVPELGGPPDEIPDPWRIVVDTRTFAVDFLTSLTSDRLLERLDRAPTEAVLRMRRAVRAIT